MNLTRAYSNSERLKLKRLYLKQMNKVLLVLGKEPIFYSNNVYSTVEELEDLLYNLLQEVSKKEVEIPSFLSGGYSENPLKNIWFYKGTYITIDRRGGDFKFYISKNKNHFEEVLTDPNKLLC